MTEEEKKYQKELWKQDRIRERREEREKIRKLGAGARLQYFWDYYKFVPAIAAAIAVVIYLAVTMIQGSRTTTLLYTLFLNTDALDPDTETLQKDYIQARGGMEKMQNMVFDSSVQVNPEANGTSQQDVSASIKITSYTGAGTLDVFLAPSHVTKFEQENGMLLELEDLLTVEELRALSEKDCLYYDLVPETDRLGDMPDSEPRTGTESGMNTERGTGTAEEAERKGGTDSETLPEKIPEETDGSAEESLNTRSGDGMHIYAVRIDPAGVIGNYDIYTGGKQVWFSIIGNSGRTEEAMRFLRFLLNEETEASSEIDAA